MYYKRAGSDDLDQTASEDLTPSQYRAAELGYFGLLRRKGMSPTFIERHGEDLFAQALFEYVRSIRAGKEIRRPVAWIVLCAWSRTVRVLEQPNWRPRMVSTESVGEISAEATSAPEDEFLTEDRYRKVREAVEHLPEYQRELLSVSYFEGISVREAARRLGWTPSKAQRAHEAAQRGLHRLLGVGRSEDLEIASGLAALLSFGPDGCDRIPQLVGGFEAALDAVAHHLHHLGERGFDLLLRPFSHGGSGAPAAADRAESLGDLGSRALSGAQEGPTSLVGRAGRRVSDLGHRMFAGGAMETTAAAADGGARVAEACKAIAVVCVIGTGAVAGGSAVLGSGPHQLPVSPQSRPVASSRHEATDVVQATAARQGPTPITAPTGPHERGAVGGASRSGPESPKPAVAGGESRPSRTQRRAHQHQTEESIAESHLEASRIAAAEEESRRSGAGTTASTGTGSTLSDSAGATQTTAPTPTSPKVAAEEAQTRTQFQGGLP